MDLTLTLFPRILSRLRSAKYRWESPTSGGQKPLTFSEGQSILFEEICGGHVTRQRNRRSTKCKTQTTTFASGPNPIMEAYTAKSFINGFLAALQDQEISSLPRSQPKNRWLAKLDETTTTTLFPASELRGRKSRGLRRIAQNPGHLTILFTTIRPDKAVFTATPPPQRTQ